MRRFRFIPTDASGLDTGKTGSGWIFEEQGPIHAFSWSPDHILEEKGRGLSVRVSSEAVREMRAWTRRSVRTTGPKVETGGLVFGELNEAAGVLWVTEVEGPPPDSDAAEDHFTCGTEGMEEAADEKNRRFRGSVACTGPAGRHLVELQPLVLAPSEEPAHLVGVGGPGGGLEIRAEKNSSAAKQAALTARTRMAGKVPSRSVSASESEVLRTSSQSAIIDTHNILYWSLL